MDADSLRVLRGEQHPHHLTAVLIMLKNFLADELTLAIAVGGEPNPLGDVRNASRMALASLAALFPPSAGPVP